MRENFLVVQMDIFGSRDVTDLDGTVLPENEMAARWGVVFTPSIYFITERKHTGALSRHQRRGCSQAVTR